MKSDKILKIIGLSTTLIGYGASFINNWVEDKKLNTKIDTIVADKVNEAVETILKERGL